jgi:pSer/pThr/pTyr-binding forkhead associated (FHA) protein
VICITCGRDNPGHLIFCQECGQKLTPRAAPPTPVVGLSGTANTGGMSGGSANPNMTTAPMEVRPSRPPRPPSLVPQRPAAPEVNFVGKIDEVDAPPETSVLGGNAEDPPCPLCGHRNPRSLRFCVTCGHLLAPPSLPPPLPPGLPASMPPLPASALPPTRNVNSTVPLGGPVGAGAAEPPPQTIRPPALEPLAATAQSPIAPGRVVDLGAPAAEAMLRLCPRCRGGSEPSSQFCRFCGASLADAPAIALAPRTPPPPALDVSVSTGGARGFDVGTSVANPPTTASAALPASVSATPIPPGPLRAHGSHGSAPPGIAASIGRSTVAMLSPMAGPLARARLVLIARDGGEGPSYPIGEAADIGRTEGNILLGDDRYVSPRHARVHSRGAAYYLRDLASTNGVFVRIPFTRESGAPRSGGGPGGGIGNGNANAAAGNHAATQASAQARDGARDGSGAPPGPEQALMDQDLFLVGQQVLKFEVVKHAEEGFGVASENGTLVFGTPAAPRYARLSQRTVEGVVRDVYHLQKAETIIGREVGDLVFTEDPFLSRRHAAIVIQGVGQSSKAPRRCSLMDLGSSNGTFLQLREEIRLKNGDHLRIGQQLFRFDLDRMDA